MPAQQKPTLADVFAQLGTLRTLLDGLTADNAAQVRQTAMMQLDQIGATAKASQLDPGTYVTAGAAGAMAALSLFSGVAGGIFIGRKFFPEEKPRPKLTEGREAEEEQLAAETPPRRRRRPATEETPR